MIDFAYMNPDFIDTILYHGNIFLRLRAMLFMSLCDDWLRNILCGHAISRPTTSYIFLKNWKQSSEKGFKKAHFMLKFK